MYSAALKLATTAKTHPAPPSLASIRQKSYSYLRILIPPDFLFLAHEGK